MNRRQILTRAGAATVFGLISLLAGGSGANSAETAEPMPIIDVHTHIIGRPKMFPGALKVAEGLAHRHGVKITVLSHVPAIKDKVMYRFPALKQLIQGRKGFAFLGGGGSLNPIIHSHDAKSGSHEHAAGQFESIARRIIRSGAAGFGEMGALHISLRSGHAYTHQPADHPLFLRLADIAAQSGLPIEIHVDAVDGSMNTPDEFADADNPGVLPGTLAGLERLIAHNPKAKISWAHGGSDPLGEMTPGRIHRMMDKYPNLYMSLRVADSRWRKSKNIVFDGDELDKEWRALLLAHSDRFFIGTDAMFLSPDMPRRNHLTAFAEGNSDRYEVTRQMLALLPKQVAEKIAYKNALRVYRLGPQPAARQAAGKTPGPGPGGPGQAKFLSEDEIRKTVIGNTLDFVAPSNGRRLIAYFAADGSVHLKVEGRPRIIRKRWSINRKGMLCRTFGRNDRKHCTKVAAGGEPKRLIMKNKKFTYRAKLLAGRQLPQ
ncbi:MAG: amidohydrolase family protein [Alphaproteobacteria bacterium]|nr:amidohydrolase family protein [Alphaproteobacteria bacterium]